MGADPRLHAHLEVLRIALDSYLRHLATAWQPGHDATSNVQTMLEAIGGVPSVDDDTRRRTMRSVAAVTAVDEGPLAHLVHRLDLELGDELLVAAAWWAELDPQLGSVFGVLHDDGTRRYPSCGLLRLVFEPYGIAVPIHPRRLINAGVVSVEDPREPLVLTATARELLGGDVRGAVGEETGLPHRLEAMVEPLADLLASGCGAVTIRGDLGSGRHALAAAAAARLDRLVVGGDRPEAELRLLAKTGVALPVLDSETAAVTWQRTDGPMVRLAAADGNPIDSQVVDVPGPSRDERSDLWMAALAELRLEPDERGVERLTEQFLFNEHDIEQATARALLAAGIEGRKPNHHDLWIAAQRQPDNDIGRVATRITPVFTFDDLVLTEDTAAKLRELVAHVRYRATVLDDWGFRRRLPRGQGVAALFSGPPGTGKTSAAEAVANELSADLFRVDLSRVVSKYIGETEKNLAIAFRQAERSGALLLFDEADALFGKRTEVRDAHDRYANLEVSYLLQRVESFTGLVILSTNKSGNLDEAFLRRLRFVVHFDSPAVELREELWRRAFPDGAAVGELDWTLLARHDLSGGHIQTAALSAAFTAVADGEVVDHDRVELAVAREYEKLERAAPASVRSG